VDDGILGDVPAAGRLYRRLVCVVEAANPVGRYCPNGTGMRGSTCGPSVTNGSALGSSLRLNRRAYARGSDRVRVVLQVHGVDANG
jgi:hypothetical protein